MKVIVKSSLVNPGGWNVGDGVEITDVEWAKKLAKDGLIELLEPMPEVIKKKAKK